MSDLPAASSRDAGGVEGASRRAPMELRWRLSLVIGVLLTAALTLAAIVAVGNTREAVQREIGASLLTAEASLDLTLSLLSDQGANDVDAALTRWSSGYAGGRHLCVAIDSPLQRQRPCAVSSEVDGVPDWFAKGADAVHPPVMRSVETEAGRLSVYLVTDPRDELREAWTDVRGLLALMGLLAFAVNGCIFVAVSRGLRPLRELVGAMDQIGRGEATPGLSHGGAYEMQVLSQGLQGLAKRLAQAREVVRRLHLRNLDVQEEERRMVARELHDEIGQHVAAIEMETIRIGRMSAAEEVERQLRLKQLRQSIAEIHRLSRSLIHRLRPPAIESLGLSAALDALFDRWRQDYPEADLRYDIESDVDRMAASRAVHLYRIAQESLSNVARHAGARKVWVGVDLQGDRIRLQVIDDGCGFDPGTTYPGFGLVGMRERVEALSGQIDVRSRAAAGTIVEVLIPVTRPQPLESRRKPLAKRVDPAALTVPGQTHA